MRLLLAEDDGIARTGMQTLLSCWGYDVTSVSDGKAAYQILCRDDSPEIGLLDWMMPHLDGVDVCRKVREQPRPRPLYLILLTARGAEEDLIAGLRAGADEYLTKPVSPAELCARLQAAQRIIELQESLKARVHDLEVTLARIKQLQGLLPICMYCKKIRDDHNYWQQLEAYVSAHSEAQFSHGICPECYTRVIEPQLAELATSGGSAAK
jgi:sigma-B regulation protein RsbU (phosphoserine phosphatase)